MQCPACAAEVPAEAENRFCEECGAALAGPSPGVVQACLCGAAEVDAEGFCLRCGLKARRVLPSDHIEQALSQGFAAVSDRGLRHDRNEDRFGLFASPAGFALVVCDGVSATRRSEIASEAVVAGVLDTLAAGLGSGAVQNPEKLLREAIAAGVSRLAARLNLETRRTSASRNLKAEDEQAPSTTVVAALVVGGKATVAWLGDSRAYWLEGNAVRQLTQDHSWQNDIVSAGTMSAEEAATSLKAHAITRWIGADAPADAVPEIAFHTLPGAGTLLLCTDGLWNHAPSEAAMAELACMACAPGRQALEAARELVRFALGRGGQDNITAALLQVGQAGPGTVRDEEN